MLFCVFLEQALGVPQPFANFGLIILAHYRPQVPAFILLLRRRLGLVFGSAPWASCTSTSTWCWVSSGGGDKERADTSEVASSSELSSDTAYCGFLIGSLFGFLAGIFFKGGISFSFCSDIPS